MIKIYNLKFESQKAHKGHEQCVLYYTKIGSNECKPPTNSNN